MHCDVITIIVVMNRRAWHSINNDCSRQKCCSSSSSSILCLARPCIYVATQSNYPSQERSKVETKQREREKKIPHSFHPTQNIGIDSCYPIQPQVVNMYMYHDKQRERDRICRRRQQRQKLRWPGPLSPSLPCNLRFVKRKSAQIHPFSAMSHFPPFSLISFIPVTLRPCPSVPSFDAL